MSDAPWSLRELQAWMQTAIMHPLGPAQNAVEEITRQLEPSQRQTATERLQIYHSAYYARLVDCLRTLLPATVKLLGEESFAAIAGAYLVQYPSTRYTLNRLADRLPEFLAQAPSGLARDFSPPNAGWQDFLRELVELELTIDKVFDAPGGEEIPAWNAAELCQLTPEAALDMRLALAPGACLLRFSFAISDFYTAVRRGEAPAIPAPKPTYLAVFRRDYVVRRYPLAAVEFGLLTVVATGATLGEAFAVICEQEAGDSAELAASIFACLRDAVAAGLIVGTRP